MDRERERKSIEREIGREIWGYRFWDREKDWGLEVEREREKEREREIGCSMFREGEREKERFTVSGLDRDMHLRMI